MNRGETRNRAQLAAVVGAAIRAVVACCSFMVLSVDGRALHTTTTTQAAVEASLFGERSLININNLSMWFRRDGWSARHPLRVNFSGVTFPRSTDQVIYHCLL